eukprot:CAMPEP_0182452596 /NCGR_PEP_ID=MMETSP1172-20130603/44334_1 /TAXON_ID=708627 /ORGANISM="Timspurckia oligopyrenoides, Strain CCMP3278" /LENGTH=874 /DNA_ID=CAMNT_0024650439 /DNA_START=62 /DNA_END=2686 /DNA_ORIENTATION=+
MVICGSQSGDLLLLDWKGALLQVFAAVHHDRVAAAALSRSRDSRNRHWMVSGGHVDGMLVVQLVFVGNDANGGVSCDASVQFRHPVGASLCAVAFEDADALKTDRHSVSSPNALDSAPRIAWAAQDGRVGIHSRNWFGGSDRVLSHRSLPVRALCWHGALLAWATAAHVGVIDSRSESKICLIDSPTHQQNVPTNTTCNVEDDLVWPSITCTTSSTTDEIEMCMSWPTGVKLLSFRYGPTSLQPLRSVVSVDIKESISEDILADRGDEMLWKIVAVVPFLSVETRNYGDKLVLLAWHPKSGYVLSVLRWSKYKYTSDSALSRTFTGSRILFTQKINFGDPQLARTGLCTISSRNVAEVSSALVWRFCEQRPSEAIDDSWAAIWSVQPLSALQRVKWLADRERFMEAFSVAEYLIASASTEDAGNSASESLNLEMVGDKLLEQKQRAGEWEELAVLIPRVIRSSSFASSQKQNAQNESIAKSHEKARWMHWLEVFSESKRLGMLAEQLPVEELSFEKDQLDSILIRLCAESPKSALTLLRIWPPKVYSVDHVLEELEALRRSSKKKKQKKSSVNDPLSTATMTADDFSVISLELYMLAGRHDQTLSHLLREGSSDVFRYVKTHDLYLELTQSLDILRALFRIDHQQAVSLLLQAPRAELSPQYVVPRLLQLQHNAWLLDYLRGAFRSNSDSISEYHSLMLEQLCQTDRKPGELLTFLKTSEHYSLPQALELLENTKNSQDALSLERIHVLSRMGNVRAALNVILDERLDVHYALELIDKFDDHGLQQQLIERAKVDDALLSDLLEHGLDHLNVSELVSLVSESRQIPQLQERLSGVLRDAIEKNSLLRATSALFLNEADSIARDFHAQLSRNIEQ